MDRYAEKAGLPAEKHKFHCLKHSLATYFLDAGAELPFGKDWLGHANIQNMTIYVRLTTGARDVAARKLFAGHHVV
jgi:site-specific recombinase XerD